MPAASPRPPEGIDIPERPTVVTSRLADEDLDDVSGSGWSRRRRILVAGAVASAGLVVALAMLVVSASHRGSVDPGEAPLIKAQDEPIKVTPESPGGMDVPNRDILVYGRLHGTPEGKPPVERLLPEPEQPLTPPEPKPQVNLSISESSMPPLSGDAQLDDDAESAPFAVGPGAPFPPAPPRGFPAPERTAAERSSAAKVATAEPAASASASHAYQVQLFASRSADDAKAAWTRLKGKNEDLLGSLSPSIARADLGNRGTFYRLRAGPLPGEAQANALCRSLSSRGMPCMTIRPGP